MQPAAFGGLRLQMQASARSDHDSLRRIGTPGMMHTSTLSFRVATLNLEQDHKRWDARRELVIDQLAALQPDVVAFNEICLPLQTGRWLQRMARERLGRPFALLQQSTVNGSSLVEGEALLTRYPVVETANWDYRTLDMVAQVVRLEIEGRLLDVYVTHLYRSRGDDALRLYQVQQLLAWIETRDDVDARVVCGDFNATLEMPSAQRMASVFRPTQTAPTAFTPLQDTDGSVSHPYWDRFDRCIDDIWVAGPLTIRASGVCFNTPSATDFTLWPSDHAGVWADLVFI
jgi:endonuclease/exonuclease/phosphatase family metal-dependent hydrolase